MKRTQWMGDVKECEICCKPITHVFIDGRTQSGHWAIMCVECHKKEGLGLGEGNGQEYWKAEDGNFYKVDG
jgi:cytochrome c553